MPTIPSIILYFRMTIDMVLIAIKNKHIVILIASHEIFTFL